MKSIIRLLLIFFSIVCSQKLLAESGLSLEKAQEIKSYIAAAQALGFSNQEVKAAFVTALGSADAHCVVTLSLNNEHKKAAAVVGGITATALVVALALYGYSEGWFSKPLEPNQPNAHADVPVGDAGKEETKADVYMTSLQARMQAESGF